MPPTQAINIGNQTAAVAPSVTDPFDYALANGFDAFEWFPDKKRDGAGWQETDLPDALRAELRSKAEAAGMRVSVHARWLANPLDPEGRITILTGLALAKDLGARLLNIHLQPEQGIPEFISAITPLIEATRHAGVQLSIENTPATSPNDFNALFAQLNRTQDLDSEHVGMCFDIGHANLCPATRNDYLGYLDRLSPDVRIIHVHAHENWGDCDSHLTLFTGPAAKNDAGLRGLAQRLEQRNYSGSIIFEQWPNPPMLLSQAREKLAALLSLKPRTDVPASVSAAARPAAGSSNKEARPATQGARGDAEFVQRLVEADRQSQSWREKLDAVYGLLENKGQPLTEPQLTDVAIYLRFLGTGQISCSEDGRHFRPVHHARISMDIQQRLGQLANPSNAFIVRKIYPWLPSSGQAFQRAEPLTRIRDIAHRNDIPKDLKHEIKHTLQNKLHRCAGPEDLATSTSLLERITRPGANYSPEFVEQFKIFHTELKEFFNASSLDDRLKGLLSKMPPDQVTLVQRFLDERSLSGLAGRLKSFETVVQLRQYLVSNPLPAPENQERVLADIALEDYTFVLLSELVNLLEGTEATDWDSLLKTLILTIQGLGFSGVDPTECHALEAELRAWASQFNAADADQLLRIKASTERCGRLAIRYSERLTMVFGPRVEHFGRAFRVPDHVVRTFCEGEVRGHVVFQLAKLTELVLRRLRSALGLPPWQVLVSGQAQGRLTLCRTLGELKLQGNDPLLVLADHAEGDEEVPVAVSGIILAHAIPHLSHLAIRARQRGVVVVALEAAAKIQELRSLSDNQLVLEADPDSLNWNLSFGASEPTKPKPNRAASVPVVELSPAEPCVPLERVTLVNGGGKAAGVKRLTELSREGATDFRVPRAIVVPFGVMEQALASSLDLAEQYQRLLRETANQEPGAFKRTIAQLRNLIVRLSPPDAIVSKVNETFRASDRLMARSSSNGEDLAQVAGAGLYESLANIEPSRVLDAVRSVWASLWTDRAALSRVQSSIAHDAVHMAVLIQQMITPDLAFVVHTVNPINRDPRSIYVEIVVGLGETLVSAAEPGTPYRFVCDKETATVKTLALANFSQAIRPAPGRGVHRETVDYSQVEMTTNPEARMKLVRRLGAIGRRVEQALGSPQDIEGAIVQGEIYLVQSRPQQGLGD